MLKDHEKFRMIDVNKEKEFFMEVNWEVNNPKINECKLVRFIHPDGSETTIERDHLISVLFAMGKEEQQMHMVPQKQQEVRWYETTVSVEAKKDIRQGERIVFPVRLSIPADESEFIERTRKPEHIIHNKV